ncbi:MAG: exopolysaccharide biosynthesis polyprenyl glycosylphosphotransferase [Deltaproteobacteria bacterium]|nr:exopolysaccharide biosynthesis polyprenyl glycosylphosphotransferase [Deltaproteobacteria bacterium]
MFYDQKKYLSLINFTVKLTGLIILFSLLIPFLYKIFSCFSVNLLPDIFFHKNEYGTIWQLVLSPALISLSTFIIHIFNGYRYNGPINTKDAIRQPIIPCLLIGCIFFVFISRFSTSLLLSAGFSLIITLILCFFLTASRFYLDQLIVKDNKNPNFIKHILITGTGQKARETGDYIISHPECGLRLVGFLTSGQNKEELKKAAHAVLGTVKDLPDILRSGFVDSIFNSGEDLRVEEIEYLVHACAETGIDFITPDTGNHARLKKIGACFSDFINNTPVLIVKFVYRPPELVFAKRMFDFTASIILISLSLPIYIAIAAAVKTTSPGPILFRQIRVGKYGRKFILYKFRSMVAHAETLQEKMNHLNEMDGPVFKIQHDPRLTNTGKFIRNTALDELPQLFNVFKGDISLVGPRPAIVKETIQYRLWERKRLSVAQGITCTWQVSRRKNRMPFNVWLQLDQAYIRDWSLAMDFRILLKTVIIVLSMILTRLKKQA